MIKKILAIIISIALLTSLAACGDSGKNQTVKIGLLSIDDSLPFFNYFGIILPAIIRHIIFPLCIPQAITSLRVGIGTAIAILFFSETFASMNGLGYYISDMMSRRNYDNMFAGIIAMTLLGLGLYGILYVIEDIQTKWQADSHRVTF